MESCLAVGKEEEKLSKKYKGFREHTETSLEDIINHLTDLHDDIAKGGRLTLKFQSPDFKIQIFYTTNKYIYIYMIL